MNFAETAKSIVCSIIAVALSMTVAAVEALLPTRPDWLERVDQLVLQLQAVTREGSRDGDPSGAESPPDEQSSSGAADGPDIDTQRLLMAYNQLWQFVHGVRSDGLSLDDKFCERVEREWTVKALLSYVRSADQSLQEKAGLTIESASTFLAAATAEGDKPR